MAIYDFLDTKLNNFFKYKSYSSTLATELKAGFSIFISMSYVVVLIPSLLLHGGLEFAAVLTTTIIMILISTCAMSLFTNRPFVLAPGIGPTAIFGYALLGSNLPQGVASGIIVVSGFIFVLVAFLGGRIFINRIIPKGIKISIGAGVGLFIALLGLKQASIIVVDVKDSALVFGDIANKGPMLAIIGFFIFLGLSTRKTYGAHLISIIIITLLGIPMGLTHIPKQLFSLPSDIHTMFGKVDILGALNIIYLPFYLTFFMSDFFGSQNAINKISKQANLLDAKKRLPGLDKNYKIDSFATVMGGFFSSPVITIYAESLEGAKRGGKTGLSSLFAALCFCVFLFCTPLCMMVPKQAIAPLLIILGTANLSSLKGISYERVSSYLPGFICIAISIFSFNGGNVGNGIAAALLIFAFLKIVNGKYREAHYFIYFLIPVIFYYFYAEAMLY